MNLLRHTRLVQATIMANKCDNASTSSFLEKKEKKTLIKSSTEPMEDTKTSAGKRSHSKGSSGNSEGKKAKHASSNENSRSNSSHDTENSMSSKEDPDFIEKINKQRLEVCAGVDKFKFKKQRVRILSAAEDFSEDSRGVLYWMSRDQRVQDNWAFLYAQRLAMKLEVPVHVCFCLVPKFLEATIRQYGFMMKGLAEVEKECRDLNIPFHVLLGDASKTIPKFLRENNIGGVVTDFSPLRLPRQWVDNLKKALPEDVPLCQVDAHNIVPCWVASPKLEYSARTIRGKIHNQLGQFLTQFPPLISHPHAPTKMPAPTDWKQVDSYLEIDRSVQEVSWAKPGTAAGLRMLELFCKKNLKLFSSSRNDPNKQALSNLSPWIHFGQISAQRCILTVQQCRNQGSESVNAFIEEALVRRELADNFCFYNENYDCVKGAYEWAQKSLAAHRKDKRPYLYSREQLEGGKTHDDLWNSAQLQMVKEGKMHGFLRMYWAKKILEWTDSPEKALSDAIYLNDRYNLDGRDPNGYVGCMWSICGIHDQGWAERAVFGKIRYMNYQGCKRKFDVPLFERKYKKNKP